MHAGLIKVCLSYENGLIPGNLHYKEPNPNNESLKNGILKVRAFCHPPHNSVPMFLFLNPRQLHPWLSHGVPAF